MTATVTPINQLRPASATEIVELPGWDENDTIYMELRRCQLRSMVLQPIGRLVESMQRHSACTKGRPAAQSPTSYRTCR